MKDEKQKPENKNENKIKKIYKKPQIKSQKILEAGLTTGCNGTTGGGRKADLAGGCSSGKLLT